MSDEEARLLAPYLSHPVAQLAHDENDAHCDSAFDSVLPGMQANRYHLNVVGFSSMSAFAV